MKFRAIHSERSSPECHMQTDLQMLSSLAPTSDPILHLYEWQKPAFTFGHFINPSDYLYLDACQQYNFEWAKRPTGGGIIFHLGDAAFSFLMPSSHPLFSTNTLENYQLVNRWVEKALKSLLTKSKEFTLLAKSPLSPSKAQERFCMAHPTEFDILCNGVKVGGAAQRRTKSGLLHQGSVSLFQPDFSLLEKVIIDSSIIKGMHQQSGALFEKEDHLMRSEFFRLLQEVLHLV